MQFCLTELDLSVMLPLTAEECRLVTKRPRGLTLTLWRRCCKQRIKTTAAGRRHHVHAAARCSTSVPRTFNRQAAAAAQLACLTPTPNQLTPNGMCAAASRSRWQRQLQRQPLVAGLDGLSSASTAVHTSAVSQGGGGCRVG